MINKKLLIQMSFLIIVLFGGCSRANTEQTQLYTETTTTAISINIVSSSNESSEESTSSNNLPEYEILYKVEEKRADGAPGYYILIDEVNLISADFKTDIEAIIKDMVSKNGKKISVEIHDDIKSLETSYKQYGIMTLGRNRTDEEDRNQEQHFIAAFSGELETDLFLNTLYYFPNANSDSKNTGKYVDIIEFNP